MRNITKKKLEKYLIIFLIFFSNFIYLTNLLQFEIKADENDSDDEIISINPIDKLSDDLRVLSGATSDEVYLDSKAI